VGTVGEVSQREPSDPNRVGERSVKDDARGHRGSDRRGAPVAAPDRHRAARSRSRRDYTAAQSA
jgi:hypothetical protein